MLKYFEKMSLTAKLVAGIIICLVFGMALENVIFHYKSEALIEKQIIESADSSMKRTIAYVEERLSVAENAILTLANRVSQEKNEESAHPLALLEASLDALNSKGKSFVGVWLFTNPDKEHPHGYFYYAYIEEGKKKLMKAPASDFYMQRDWYKGAMEKKGIYWGEPYQDLEEKGSPFVSTVSIPFKFNESKELNGVISVSFDLKEMQDKIKNSTQNETAKILLLTRKGLYITHPNPEVQLKRTIFDLAKEYRLPQLEETGKSLQDGKNGVVKMQSSSVFPEPVLFFYAPVPLSGWGICIVVSQSQFFAPLHTMSRVILILSIVSFCIVIFLVVWICKRSLRPLLTLSDVAKEIGKGHFDTPLPKEYSKDEIGSLFYAFHKMKESLATYLKKEKEEIADKQKRESELEIATQIQKAVLPKDFAITPLCDLYASMTPAKEVGGDFYDFFMIDRTHIAFIIADVSGKGIPGALFMMRAKTVIKNLSLSGHNLATIFKQANAELCTDNQAQMFVTALMMVLDLKTGLLLIVNAGHNPPLFKLKGQKYEYWKVKPALALGMMQEVSYEVQTYQMHPGESFFLYTDGLPEAQNKQQKFYGSQQLQEALNSADSLMMKDLISSVKNEIETFSKETEPFDDMTMLGFTYQTGDKKTLTVPAIKDELPKILRFAEKQLKKKNFTEEQIHKMLISIEEIFVNIAYYAYPQGLGEVKIELITDDEMAKIRFHDKGIPFNPLKKDNPDLMKDMPDRKIGGLGIFMVKNMMNKVEYNYINHENILTLYLTK